MAERSPAKDKLAWTIIYGGTSALKFLLCTAAPFLGLMDKYQARQLSKYATKLGPAIKKQAWEKYQRTGDIWTMFDAD